MNSKFEIEQGKSEIIILSEDDFAIKSKYYSLTFVLPQLEFWVKLSAGCGLCWFEFNQKLASVYNSLTKMHFNIEKNICRFEKSILYQNMDDEIISTLQYNNYFFQWISFGYYI